MAVRRSLRRWELAGFFFVCAAGALLWWGRAYLPAELAGANDSAWERMKLLYLPFFLFSAAELYVFANPYRNFFAAKAAAALTGLLTLPLLHYTLTGMFGPLPFWAAALVFALSAAALFFTGERLLNGFALRGGVWQIAGFAALWALLALFILFTRRTPRLPLFRDPVTFQYGL